MAKQKLLTQAILVTLVLQILCLLTLNLLGKLAVIHVLYALLSIFIGLSFSITFFILTSLLEFPGWKVPSILRT